MKLVQQEPQLFARARSSEASLRLGVGNRKVVALRFWMHAMGLIDTQAGNPAVSPLGATVAHFDPYFQEPGTWQILHWKLASHADGASAYWHLVHKIAADVVSRSALKEHLAASFPAAKARTVEDATFVTFSLLRDTPLSGSSGLFCMEGDAVRKRRLAANDLALGVFAYAVMEWAALMQRSTANLEEFDEPGCPGRAFGLPPAAVEDGLSRVQERYGKEVLWLSHTAGLNSVAFNHDVNPLNVVEAYYLEQLEAMAPYAALQYAKREGLSARLLAEADAEVRRDA